MEEFRILIAAGVACALVVLGLLFSSHDTTTKIVPGVPASQPQPKY
jgi:hypothetical protein